jgi:hypothetical protein
VKQARFDHVVDERQQVRQAALALDRVCRNQAVGDFTNGARMLGRMPDRRPDPVDAEAIALFEIERDKFAIDLVGRELIIPDNPGGFTAVHASPTFPHCANGPAATEQGSCSLHHYHAFGLKLASDLALPELRAGSEPADVRIRFRRFPEGTAEPVVPWAELTPGGIIMRMEGIRYIVLGGDSIDITAPAGTSEEDVRVWLLGSVSAALLHQRGYLPLHANVIVRPSEGAVAFAGDSGAGKSTLAAWMESEGHRVLTDDLCAIALDACPMVFESIPRMKLWPETLEAFGRSSDGLTKVASDLDKYHVPLARAPAEDALTPRQLTRVYLLDRAANGEPFRIDRLTGMAAADGILSSAFRWEIGQLIHGGKRAQFDQCVEVARHSAVFRICRTWDMERLDEEAKAIERHLMTPLEELRASPGAP